MVMRPCYDTELIKFGGRKGKAFLIGKEGIEKIHKGCL